MKELLRHPVYYVSKIQNSVAFERWGRGGCISPCRVRVYLYTALDLEILLIIINYVATKLEFTELSTAWRETDHVVRYEGRSSICEKRQLASSCLSVCPSVRNKSAPTKIIFVKFDV